MAISEHVSGFAQAVGWRSALNVFARRALKIGAPVQVRSGRHTFTVRPRDSDLFVASQIFGHFDYDLGVVTGALNRLAMAWCEDGHVPVIIDGGGNVGYSALYFAATFPDAIVVAVEADAETFAQLVQNCRGESRIIPVHAALWSHERGVDLRSSGSNGSWGIRVAGGDGLTPSRLLSSVIELVPGGRPLIIKLDIEGAELEVCGAAKAVLATAPCILIEPHDFMLPGAGCLQTLYEAVAGRKVDTLLKGENLVIFDSTLAGASHNRE